MERGVFLALAAPVALAGVLAGGWSGPWIWGLVAAGVAAVGLPHGALDTRLATVNFALETWRGVTAFIAAYVGLAAAVAGLWVAAPVVALAAFLAYAALHFGQDWTGRPLAATVFGAAVIALPAWRFEPEVAAIFAAMTGSGAGVAAVLHAVAPFALAAALVLAGALRDRGAAIEIGAYAVLALAVPPHVAFAVYFCALHSPRHFRETAGDLGLSVREAMGAAMPYTLPVAVVGAAVAGVFLASGNAVPEALARVIFVGLACLTVPHMLLEMVVERPALRQTLARAAGSRALAPRAASR